MWENKYEAEKIEKQQQEYDKLAAVGLKKLKILSISLLVVLLFHIAVLGIQSPVVMIGDICLLLAALAGFYKNSDIGFYSFCASLFISTAIWVSDIYKFIVLALAVFGNPSEVKMWLSFFAMLMFLVCYIVSLKFLFFDDDIRVWKSYRRHTR